MQKFLVNSEAKIIEAMRKVDEGGIGIIFIVNNLGEICGSLSDGDIRKAILLGIDVHTQKVEEIMRKDPIFLREEELGDENKVNLAALSLFQRNPRGGFIPVLNSQKNIKEIIHFSGFKKQNFNHKEELVSQKYVNGVLIVGGAGYLGSIIARKLLTKGYRVKILDNFLFGKDSLREIWEHPNIDVIEGDVRDISKVSEALEGVDAAIHLAAIVGDPACKTKPLDAIEINYLATKTLAEACKYRQINRFLFASTCSLYGHGEGSLTEDAPLNPLSLYAKSKVTSEKGILEMKDKNFAPCSLRMGTLYGLSPRMRFDLVVNVLTAKAMNEGVITIFGGEQWRPMLHVEDAADAYIQCLENPIEKTRGEIFNVGSNEQNHQIIDLGKIVNRVVPEAKIEVTQKEIIEGAMDQRDYNVSFDKIKNILNFNPARNVEEGAREIKKAIEEGNFRDYKDKKYYNVAIFQN